MTYITARFGQIVAKPATAKTPGFFGLRNIGPVAEEKIAILMATAVAKEGHKAKLPYAFGGSFSATDHAETALALIAQPGGATTEQVRAACGITADQAHTVMGYLRRYRGVTFTGGKVKRWRLDRR